MGTIADIDEIMYQCGLETLHPGGLHQTDALARMCGVAAGTRVLDVGSGKGATALHLARTHHCTVVGLDRSDRMVAYASRRARETGLEGRATFVRGEAEHLPFEDESFDAVLSECTTTLLDRDRAFAQFLRVLKRGGRLGDSDVMWRKPPPRELTERIRVLWDGFATMTLDEWRAYGERLGLVDVRVADFSQPMATMEMEMTRELGPAGLVRLGMVLLARPGLGHSLNEYRKLIRDYGEYFGYGSLVGTKA